MSKYKSTSESEYLARVVSINCILCRVHLGITGTPCEIHHPRTGTGAASKASHYDAIGLCPSHHRLGNEALHTMGRKAWERHYGITEIELMQITKNLLGVAS